MTNEDLLDALEHTYRSLLDVARHFDAEDWARPTDCPGWTVKDHLSHLAGMERVLLGEPECEHAVPEGLPHVRNAMGEYMERPVDARRPIPGPDVLAELTALVDRRIAQLRALDAAGWDADAPGMMGTTTPTSRFIPIIVFDRWTHEQDVRRAVGRTGNLAGPGAQVAMERTAMTLPIVVPRAVDAPEGTRVDIVATGPLGRTIAVAWGEAGRSPDATITADDETVLRLATGRIDPHVAVVTVDGDRELAARVIDGMAFTP